MPRSGFGGGCDRHGLRAQPLDHAAPARSVGERAVHQDDGGSMGGRGSVGHRCSFRIA